MKENTLNKALVSIRSDRFTTKGVQKTELQLNSLPREGCGWLRAMAGRGLYALQAAGQTPPCPSQGRESHMPDPFLRYFKHSTIHRYANYVKLIAVSFLLLMVSCKARKQMMAKGAATDTTARHVSNKRAKLNAIRAGQTSFDAFSGKARTTLDINGNSNDVTLNIHIKKDKKIWISITAIAGIEVARVLITPDSIMIINRLQSVYLRKPFSYINKFAGDQVNYKTIESLLIGNAIPELINEDADLRTSPDSIALSGNLQDLVYKLIIGPDMKVTQTNLSNQNAGQSMQVNNNTFIQSGSRTIPSQIDITSLVKDEKIQVNLHYIKSVFDQPLEFPFSIPTRYKEED
jgi:hypothetical protein